MPQGKGFLSILLTIVYSAPQTIHRSSFVAAAGKGSGIVIVVAQPGNFHTSRAQPKTKNKKKIKRCLGTSHHGSVETNLTSIHEAAGLIPGLAQWVKGSSVALSCSVDRRRGWDLAFLRLWCRPVATASLWPLAWEIPYAVGVALKRQNKQTKTVPNAW